MANGKPLNELFHEYAWLEVEKRENAKTLKGIDLQISAAKRKAEDLTRRGAALAAIDSRREELISNLQAKGQSRLSLIDRIKQTRETEKLADEKAQIIAGLRNEYGIGENAIIETAAKFSNQVKKAHQSKKLITPPEKIEAQQKRVHQTFQKRVEGGERPTQVKLPSNFARENSFDRESKLAFKEIEKNFQREAGLKAEERIKRKGIIPKGKTIKSLIAEGKRNWQRFSNGLSSKIMAGKLGATKSSQQKIAARLPARVKGKILSDGERAVLYQAKSEDVKQNPSSISRTQGRGSGKSPSAPSLSRTQGKGSSASQVGETILRPEPLKSAGPKIENKNREKTPGQSM